jgi:hypothetical protein
MEIKKSLKLLLCLVVSLRLKYKEVGKAKQIVQARIKEIKVFRQVFKGLKGLKSD